MARDSMAEDKEKSEDTAGTMERRYNEKNEKVARVKDIARGVLDARARARVSVVRPFGKLRPLTVSPTVRKSSRR